MRLLGLAVAGVFALTVSVAGHAAPLGSSMKQVAPAGSIVQIWGGCGWGWHPVPGHWSLARWVGSSTLRAKPLLSWMGSVWGWARFYVVALR